VRRRSRPVGIDSAPLASAQAGERSASSMGASIPCLSAASARGPSRYAPRRQGSP
jgi:hypothetical protein